MDETGQIDPNAIINAMKKLGFQEAKNIMEHPIVPGSDGMDMLFWRESDKKVVQISYRTKGWFLTFGVWGGFQRTGFVVLPEYHDIQNFDHEIPAQKIANAIAKMLNMLIKRRRK